MERLLIPLLLCCWLIPACGIANSSDASKRIKGENYPTYPTVNYGSGIKAQQIRHGEYLVKMGDCIACHTEHHKDAKQFAGGFGIETPFGTIYTPNITGDGQTGIGSWTDKEFIKALREGVSPKHYYYYPAFPYLHFNKITTQDLKDIKAYLMAIPKVHQANKIDAMLFPFNLRFLQIGWRILFFHFQKTGPYQPDPNHSTLWNRGAYLVEGLGHCGMCHTPSHYFISEKFPLAAPIEKYRYSGAMVQGYFAPNITRKLLGSVPEKDLEKVFKDDELVGGGKVMGPMKEANHDSLKYMTQDDIKAVYVYLSSIHSESEQKASSGGGKGEEIYNQYCFACHKTGAGGAPKLEDKAAWEPRIKLGMKTLYKNAIHGIGGMPAKGTCSSCTDKDIELTVDYMVAQVKGGSSSNTPTTKPVPKLTLADGKAIYEKHCAFCHNPEKPYKNAPVIGDKKQWEPIIAQGMPAVFLNTINGYGNMPKNGGCKECNNAQIIAAVKYMVEQSKTKGDYSLW